MKFTIIALGLWLASMWIVKTDIAFNNRFWGLGLYLGALILVSIIYLCSKKIRLTISTTEDKWLLVILGVSLLSRFIFLKNYPFASIGDEVRDGGLDAMRIVGGQIKNIFAYGSYSSHGLIIPTFSSFFYLIFKNSVFTYRVLAALLSWVNIWLLYLTVRYLISPKAGLWSAIILASLPLHLFFGRTEIVVIFSSFLTTLVLMFFLMAIKHNKTIDWIMLGTVLGFASGFHTSVRTVTVITLGFAAIWMVINSIKQKNYKFFGNLFLLLLFGLMGFGPRLWFTPPEIFFQKRSLKLEPNLNTIVLVGKNYEKSLLGWVSERVTFHYPDTKPILPVGYAILFVLSLPMVFLGKNNNLRWVGFYGLILPFTNSAITEAINCDHRLASLLPIGSIMVATGVVIISDRLKNNWLRWIFSVIVVGYSIYLIVTFFSQEPANNNKTITDYVSMNAIYLVNNTHKGSICWLTSKEVAKNLDLMHYKEQRRFFLPNLEIMIEGRENITDNQLYMVDDCRQTKLPDRVFIKPLKKITPSVMIYY